MKIISYNVNGIRAALKKGLDKWLRATNADIVCLQEVKANDDPKIRGVFEAMGYHVYWYAAEKKGYSGVAIFSKVKPLHVDYGCGIDIYDREGRVIRADFDDFSVMSVYMPSGSSGEVRQAFKMKWLEDFNLYIQDLIKEFPAMVIGGDYNICKEPIDIHNPVSNKKSSGFLPEERSWLNQFIDANFIDSFRYFNNEPHNYSWWTYRMNARERNLGWRIDYNLVTKPLEKRLKRASILSEAFHSDHCPVLVELS